LKDLVGIFGSAEKDENLLAACLNEKLAKESSATVRVARADGGSFELTSGRCFQDKEEADKLSLQLSKLVTGKFTVAQDQYLAYRMKKEAKHAMGGRPTDSSKATAVKRGASGAGVVGPRVASQGQAPAPVPAPDVSTFDVFFIDGVSPGADVDLVSAFERGSKEDMSKELRAMLPDATLYINPAAGGFRLKVIRPAIEGTACDPVYAVLNVFASPFRKLTKEQKEKAASQSDLTSVAQQAVEAADSSGVNRLDILREFSIHSGSTAELGVALHFKAEERSLKRAKLQ